MSTRSIIAEQRPDKSVRAIYVHNDGYPKHNGVLLNQFYDKLNEPVDRKTPNLTTLLDGGFLQCLSRSPEESQPLTRCGDPNSRAKEFADMKSAKQHFDLHWTYDYIYLYRHGLPHNRWYVRGYEGKGFRRNSYERLNDVLLYDFMLMETDTPGGSHDDCNAAALALMDVIDESTLLISRYAALSPEHKRRATLCYPTECYHAQSAWRAMVERQQPHDTSIAGRMQQVITNQRTRNAATMRTIKEYKQQIAII